MTALTDLLARLGARTLAVLHGWGHAAIFFFDLLRALPASLRRFGQIGRASCRERV